MPRKGTGRDYYKGQGFTKPILTYVSPETHKALMAEAKQQEQSLQVIVRRILDKHAKT